MSMAAMRNEVDLLRDLLQRNHEIMIVGHKDADGDTLGCSLAFGEALRAMGKHVHVVIPPPLPQKYSWMPGFDRIVESPLPGAGIGLVLFFGSVLALVATQLPAPNKAGAIETSSDLLAQADDTEWQPAPRAIRF